jgi:UTP-glucose-1-phosphate uridylyltransferase
MNAREKIRKVVLPVGGFGTRFLPATKAIPKEMMPVGNVPLIQHALEEARDAGIEQFIFITGRNKNAIMNHFDVAYELDSRLSESAKIQELALTRNWLPSSGKTIFIRQQRPAGLGHAIMCAKGVIGNEPFAVILADELFVPGVLRALIETYNSFGGSVLGLAEVSPLLADQYGIASVQAIDSRVSKVIGLVEKPNYGTAPSNLSVAGRYVLQPEIFDFLQQTLPGRNNEIQLTDALSAMLTTSDVFGCTLRSERFDCGSPLGWLEANIASFLKSELTSVRAHDMLRKYSCTYSE